MGSRKRKYTSYPIRMRAASGSCGMDSFTDDFNVENSLNCPVKLI